MHIILDDLLGRKQSLTTLSLPGETLGTLPTCCVQIRLIVASMRSRDRSRGVSGGNAGSSCDLECVFPLLGTSFLTRLRFLSGV